MKTDKYEQILLFSGGPDSHIAWEYLNCPQTLYIGLEHRYKDREITVVRELVPDTIYDFRLSLKDWEEADANIPMRNAFFLMIASHYSDDLVLVVQQGEMSIPDRSEKFFRSFGSWLSWMNNRPIRISTPFAFMTKTDMVEWYIQNGHNTDKLRKTRSCFSSGLAPCHACPACFRRWVAFTNNGIKELHDRLILDWDGVQKYVEEMKEDKYDKRRKEETFRALKRAGYKL